MSDMKIGARTAKLKKNKTKKKLPAVKNCKRIVMKV